MRICLLLLALPVMSLVAAAQGSDAIGRARPHFESGQQYYRDGQYADALRELRTAYELTHHPELLYNIALCYEHLGDFDHAIESLRTYLASSSNVAERAEAQERLGRLEGAVAQRSQLDRPAPPPPPEPEPVAAPPVPAPTPQGAPLPVLAIGVLAGAGASLIAGAISGGASLAEHDSLAASCAPSCSGDQLGGLHALTITTDVLFAVSLAAAVVGALILIFDPPRASASARLGPDGLSWSWL